jgi:hypothetical protein
VVLIIPAVELEHERVAGHEQIVDQAVGMVGVAGLRHAEEPLVPGAAGFYVADGDQGLRADCLADRASRGSLLQVPLLGGH